MQSCACAGNSLQRGLLSVTWTIDLRRGKVATRAPLRPGLQQGAAQRSKHHAAKQCARWQVSSISSSKPLRC